MFGLLLWWLYFLISNTTVALKPNFMSSLLLRTVFLLICIFLNHSWNLNLHNKNPKNSCFHIFGLKCWLHLGCLVKAVKDDISVKTITIWWHHTVLRNPIRPLACQGACSDSQSMQFYQETGGIPLVVIWIFACGLSV